MGLQQPFRLAGWKAFGSLFTLRSRRSIEWPRLSMRWWPIWRWRSVAHKMLQKRTIKFFTASSISMLQSMSILKWYIWSCRRPWAAEERKKGALASGLLIRKQIQYIQASLYSCLSSSTSLGSSFSVFDVPHGCIWKIQKRIRGAILGPCQRPRSYLTLIKTRISTDYRVKIVIIQKYR